MRLQSRDQIQIRKKARKVLGVVRRNLQPCSSRLKEIAYQTLVRPHLEYACSAWDPYLQKDVIELDKVQNCAARMVSGNYNYGPGTLTAIMSNLNWDSLGDRRRMSRLSMMYKIVNGLVAIEADEFLQQPSRFTKRSNEHNFQTIRARTDTYAQLLSENNQRLE